MLEEVRIVKEDILKNADKTAKGENVGFPWRYLFPRLGKFLPVIPQGTQMLITANSGVGKSHTWVGMVLFSYYKIKKDLPTEKLNVKFLIALLEDTKQMFISRLFCMILYDKYNIRVDPLSLNSMRGSVLSDDVKSKLDDIESEIQTLLADCEIIDSVYNPTGLYKWARQKSNELGTHHKKKMQFSKDNGESYEEEVYSHFEYNDTNLQVLLIVDNLNNLQQEVEEGRLLSERETINKWTRKYCRLQIVKHYKFTVINIIQQSAESEKAQYNMKGELVIEKVKPSLDGLGNSKECQRDCLIILGLFAPDRYGIKEYAGYDISRLQDSFRSVIILKSNISECNKEIPLYFDGACSRFQELPLPAAMTEDVYKACIDRKVKIKINK